MYTSKDITSGEGAVYTVYSIYRTNYGPLTKLSFLYCSSTMYLIHTHTHQSQIS